MRRFLPLVLAGLLLVSCTPVRNLDRTIYVVSVADDFYGYNGSTRRLDNVITDQAALLGQLATLGDIQIRAFISERGERYFSTAPHFIPVDKNGEELRDEADLAFQGFSFRPTKSDFQLDWTMKDVLEEILSLPAMENDLVFFLYSGHGEEGTGNLLTNGEPDSTLYETMGVGNILDALEATGGRKVLFIDACFSGHFLPTTNIANTDVFEDEGHTFWGHFGLDNAWKEAIHPKATNERKDLWILASASKGQEALDSADYFDSPFQGAYGAFTYYLLKGLGYNMEYNRPQEKHGLTFYSLFREIRWNYPHEALEGQTPLASLGGIDLVLSQ